MGSFSIKNGNHKVFINLTGILVFFMMIFPAQAYSVKISCLCLMLLFMKKKIIIEKSVTFLLSSYIIYGIYGLTIGLIKATEYPFALTTVAIIYPLLFTLFIGQKYTQNDFLLITKSLFFAHCFIVFYDLLFCLSVINGFYFPAIYPPEQIFSFYGTTSRLGFINLNSITFTSPIFILIWMTGYKIGIKRWILSIVIGLTLFLLVLSGRRSMMGLAFAIIPVTYFFRTHFGDEYIKSIKHSILSLSFIILISLGYIIITAPDIFDGYLETFTKAFDSDQEPIKYAQSQMLMDTFKDNPIFGVGVGKELFEPAPGRIGFTHQFELQYHLVLAQTGIIGFILKMIFVIGTLGFSIYLGRKYNTLLLIYSVGFLFILIADFTNPVLCSFDFFLSAYILITCINNIEINYSHLEARLLNNEKI